HGTAQPSYRIACGRLETGYQGRKVVIVRKSDAFRARVGPRPLRDGREPGRHALRKRTANSGSAAGTPRTPVHPPERGGETQATSADCRPPHPRVRLRTVDPAPRRSVAVAQPLPCTRKQLRTRFVGGPVGFTDFSRASAQTPLPQRGYI